MREFGIAELQVGEEIYTYDWFTHNASEWPRLVASYAGQPNLEFLEVGSFEGRSACWLLKHALTGEGSRLTCIDLFEDAMGGADPDMPSAVHEGSTSK